MKSPPCSVSVAGLPAETLAFLAGIRAENNRGWFEAHRADYEAAGVTVLGVSLERVRVVLGDTDNTPYGGGTWASRGAGIPPA